MFRPWQECTENLNPNVVYPRRRKTRQSVPDVGARRLGQDEQYLSVREILSEASTLADGALSRERSDFYRFGDATLGLYPTFIICFNHCLYLKNITFSGENDNTSNRGFWGL